MKLLLDEDILGDKGLYKMRGWEVSTVKDVGLRSAPDETVVKYARENGFIVITKDKGMKELANAAKVECILIDDEMIVEMIDRELREEHPEQSP